MLSRSDAARPSTPSASSAAEAAVTEAAILVDCWASEQLAVVATDLAELSVLFGRGIGDRVWWTESADFKLVRDVETAAVVGADDVVDDADISRLLSISPVTISPMLRTYSIVLVGRTCCFS